MHPDIEKTIDLIDHKIIELQRAKRTLVEAFGEKNIQVDNKSSFPSGSLRKTKRKKRTRKHAVMKLLRQEGPLARSEILEKTGIPLGTVSFILNDKITFRHKEGKWNLVKESQNEQKEKDLTGSE